MLCLGTSNSDLNTTGITLSSIFDVEYTLMNQLLWLDDDESTVITSTTNPDEEEGHEEDD